MSKIIIFDFEVFKNDVLLGAVVLNEDTTETLFQTWDKEKIKQFYFENVDSIWVGHNNDHYDNFIMEAIVKDKDVKAVNDAIIKDDKYKYARLSIQMYSYDILSHCHKPFSLKTSEALIGHCISESEVNFDLDRSLTDEEKLKTESYNRDDLEQTKYNFKAMIDMFAMRVNICKEFKLPLSALSLTGTQIGALALHSKRNEAITKVPIKPKLYDTLLLENKEIKEFYLNEDFKTDKKINIKIGNAEIKIGAGGAHSAINQYHAENVIYFDVSGYYNLVMMNYDLLPRTMNEDAKKLYKEMYYEQLRLKKINPLKRGVLKVILLSVFGATTNEHTDFYDPYKGPLITMTGQLFICDLLEKVKDYVTIVQTNTDGIIVEPNDWNEKDKIVKIVEEWEARTGFVIKKEIKHNLWQRDVNCYFMMNDEGDIEYKGNTVKNFDIGLKSFADGQLFDCAEPPIIAQSIINFLEFNTPVEEFVEKNKDNLLLFQYVCKKKSYDYSCYELTDLNTNETTITKLQGINRAFAMKDKTKLGVVKKYKVTKTGEMSSSKIANLPESVFIYDDEILSDEAKSKIIPQIDYEYYIERAYEKMLEFTTTKEIKSINV